MFMLTLLKHRIRGETFMKIMHYKHCVHTESYTSTNALLYTIKY